MTFAEVPPICGTGMLAARRAGLESAYRAALRVWSRGRRDDAAKQFDAPPTKRRKVILLADGVPAELGAD